MKIWFSWWSRGYAGTDSFHLACLQVAAARARKFFPWVGLITDTPGRARLSGWFDFTSTDLDAVPHAYAPVWALAKLWAYRRAAQDGAFLHLDHDFFLQADLPEAFLSAPLCAAHREGDVERLYRLPWFRSTCPAPGRLARTRLRSAPNCGLLGGQDTAFLSSYAQEGIDLILAEANKDYWFRRHRWPYWWLSVIPEQGLLSACAQGREFSYLLDVPPQPGAPARHLMGDKTDPLVQEGILREAADLTPA